MIKHILKIMKSERKSNSWIMLELLLVFVVMWFCYDYLNFMIRRYNQPIGHDVEHTYVLEFGMKDEYKEQYYSLSRSNETDSIQQLYADDGMLILERIKQMPYIESACFSQSALPYGNANSQYGFTIDSINESALTRIVSPEYFDVYKINVRKYPWYDWANSSANQLIISPDERGLFIKKAVDSVNEVGYGENNLLRVAGIANKLKFIDYQRYIQMVFLPIDKWATVPSNHDIDISIRVKPNADSDFIYKFKNDVQDKLDIGPYYFINIRSMEKQREYQILAYGYTDSIRNVAFVIAFIVINVFLGVFGTFWFRTQSRRSEIGLRCAIGSSKRQISSLILVESLLMLFIISIPATIISLFFSFFEVVNQLGVPSVYHNFNDLGLFYYISNYLGTMIVLAIMIFFGTYFPARQAMNIQPSDALRAE